MICGHYEGIDARVCELAVDEEISIGDFVLSGGELGAMVVIDAVSRYLPNVLGDEDSVKDESFLFNVSNILTIPDLFLYKVKRFPMCYSVVIMRRLLSFAINNH